MRNMGKGRTCERVKRFIGRGNETDSGTNRNSLVQQINSLSRSRASRPASSNACWDAIAVCVAPHICSQLHSRPKQFGASELALFYRKGLIALPITDNATINDLGEGRGKE